MGPSGPRLPLPLDSIRVLRLFAIESVQLLTPVNPLPNRKTPGTNLENECDCRWWWCWPHQSRLPVTAVLVLDLPLGFGFLAFPFLLSVTEFVTFYSSEQESQQTHQFILLIGLGQCSLVEPGAVGRAGGGCCSRVIIRFTFGLT